MPRICTRCNRPLEPEFHDITEPEPTLVQRGRGRMMTGKRRRYGCKVRPITVSEVGRIAVPETMQHTKDNPAVYRHESRLT